MIRLFLEDKMEAIKVGVIGCGYWGPNLIRNLVDISQAEVVGVSDLRESRLNHIRNLYPRIFTTQNYKDLFSLNLDAVVVATPPATHYAIAKECMENGLNVLIEKPITTNSADAQELVDLAARKDLTLMVGHTFEYNPAVRALKELIDQGEIGQVYYMNSIRVNLGLFQRDLNVLWDLAPHDLSIFLYLLGMRPISVSAQGNDSVFKGIHDLVYLNLVFPNEVFAHIHVSWLDPCKVRRTTVVGSKKMVVYDDVEVNEKIKVYDKGVDTPEYTDTFSEFQCSYRSGDILIPNIRFVEPLRMECQHFLDSIQNHTEPQSSGIVGLEVVKILEAAQRSLMNGAEQEAIEWPQQILTASLPM
jgi:predicted dehydrogenase